MNLWFLKNKQELPHEAVLKDESQRPSLDVYSPSWKFVNNWAEKRLQQLRESNDSPNLDAAKTALKRGEIRNLKDLIDLPNKVAGKQVSAHGILNRQ